MTDPYRAMCAELVDSLHKHTSMWEGHEIDVVARARDLLAQPVAEGPTDEEIMELMPQQMRRDLAQAARAMAWVNEHDSTCAAGAIRIILNRHAVDHARAALSRYSRP